MLAKSRLTLAALAAVALFLESAFGAGAAGLKVTERKLEEKKRAYEIEYAYPQTGVPAIDHTIEAWIKEQAQTFAGYAKDWTPQQQNPYSGEISYEVQRNDGTAFAVLFSYYTYTGGAHPNSNYTAFNFLLPDGADVEIGEVFTNAGIERISKLSIASLKHDLMPNGDGDGDWIAKGAAANGANFENFILKPNELAIYFDAYHVAAYAVGPQEVHIPLAQLRSFMRPDPRAPSPGFDCAKASTDVEHAVCSSRELARLDRHIADKYFDALLWGPDDAARAKLRNAQRAWLVARDAQCRGAAQALTACLMTSYQGRWAAMNKAEE